MPGDSPQQAGSKKENGVELLTQVKDLSRIDSRFEAVQSADLLPGMTCLVSARRPP